MSSLCKGEFFSYSWHIDEQESDQTIIRIFGLDENNKNICIIVKNFTPYVYLELPPTINWDTSKATLLSSRLNEILEFQPVIRQLMFKKKLHYAHLDDKLERKVFPFLFCSFSHHNHIKKLEMKLRRPIHVSSLGNMILKVHEQNANPILQLTSVRSLPTAGWIDFLGKKIPDSAKTTTVDFEYEVKWKDLAPSKKDIVANPLLMGFDLEVNSSIPSSMPKATRDKDKIFQISCVFSRQGSKNIDRKILITLGKPNFDLLEDSEVICCDTEADLITSFTDIVQEHNPNILIGYNIFTFDIPYMIDRAKLLFVFQDFDKLGFVKFQHSAERTIKWSSSAYKNQSFQFLDAEGRIFVDLLPLVRRDYKMANYKLETISKHFLKNLTKDPLDAQGIFKCYRLGMQGGVKGAKALSICGKYCIKDSELVVRLFDTLTTWVALCEMSKVTNVPIFMLYTQGQQLKVFSQVYKKCSHENIVVEKNGYIAKENDHYAGATVFDPTPGVYDMVVSYDFCALYPSSIIAKNICWSTLVQDESIPDSLCHVMEWDDHFSCEHDPKQIRKKELTDNIKEKEVELKEMRKKRDLKANKERKQEFNDEIEEFKKSVIKPLRDERAQINKSKTKHVICAHRKFRWLKSPMGVLPEILTHLLDTRALTKKELKNIKVKLKTMKEDDDNYSETSVYCDILDQRQLALKLSANSAYGILGASKGYLPFLPGAMSTTYYGRCSIDLAANIIQTKYGGKLIYGDSVSGDTPIIFKQNNTIQILSIQDLSSNWSPYEEFKAGESNRKEKQQSLLNIEVWTKGKWSKVVRVIRHKTVKKMYRILTHKGCIDTTEDHSLLRENGEKVKPEALNVGESLLHSFPTEFEYDFKRYEIEYETNFCSSCKNMVPNYEFYNDQCKVCKKCCYYCNHRKNPNVSDFEYLKSVTVPSKEEAFVWGFFMADGSAGYYDCKKHTWAINNQNLEYLNRTQKYLEKIEPMFTFKILESSHVYKLVATGKVRLLATKYRRIMYDSYKNKIVPTLILNSPLEIRQWFFEGYYAGDGYKPEQDNIIPSNGSVRMDCKGKIGCQGLFYLLKSIGYENVSVNTRETKPKIFRINGTKGKFRKNPTCVKKIIRLPDIGQDEFVYDLETEEGVFHAGIGELIVKNTDSNYVTFPHLKTAAECWDYSIKVSKEVSALYPKPMSLAFEDKVYLRYFILSKKRYMCLESERDGLAKKDISKKGVLLQRRDNCNFIRTIYGNTVQMIFNKDSKEKVISYVLDELNNLCSSKYPSIEFVITKSVGDIGDLIPRQCIDDKNKECIKVGDYKIRKTLPPDKNQAREEMDQVEADNEEDYYLKLLPAQVQLAEKMRRRGQLVSAGSRLEYLITTTGGLKAKQCEKIESIEYFTKHSSSLKVDYMYYLKLLANPMNQILGIIYPEEKTFFTEQYKFRIKREKVINEIKKIFRRRIIIE